MIIKNMRINAYKRHLAIENAIKLVLAAGAIYFFLNALIGAF